MFSPVSAGSSSERARVPSSSTAFALAAFAVACGSSPSGGSAVPLGSTGGSAGAMTVAPGTGGGVTSAGGAVASTGGSPVVAGMGGTPAGAGGAAPVGMGGAVVAPSSGGAASGGAPTTGTGGAPTAGPAPFELSIAIPTAAPGEENTMCVQSKLPNTAPVDIVKLHNTLSQGSHHFIVSALNVASAAEMPLTACRPFRAALQGGPLAITQKKDDVVETPSGVAYSLNANQVISLELHYINTGTEPLSINAKTELYPAAPGSNLQQSTVLLVGTGTFSIPPKQSTTTGPRYIQMPAVLDGVNYFAITGHTHHLGTGVQVSSAASATAQATSLYAPTPYDWDSPVLVPLNPAAKLPTGGGFVLKCDWNNTTSATVTFGESANAEMCFFWAYYYPKKSVSSLIVEGLGPVDPALAISLGF